MAQTLKNHRIYLTLRTLYICAFIICLLLFHYHPEIDISLAKWVKQNNAHFIKHITAANYIINLAVYVAIIVLGASLIICIIRYIIKPTHSRLHSLYIFTYYNAVMLVCWLFAIHYAIKRIFARARPYQIIELGGDKAFSEAWALSDQCLNGDCSFVSGHAAAGFLLYAAIFTTHNITKKWLYFLSGSLLGIFCGTIRILMNMHFLSDVIFANFITMLFCYLAFIAISAPFKQIHTQP